MTKYYFILFLRTHQWQNESSGCPLVRHKLYWHKIYKILTKNSVKNTKIWNFFYYVRNTVCELYFFMANLKIDPKKRSSNITPFCVNDPYSKFCITIVYSCHVCMAMYLIYILKGIVILSIALHWAGVVLSPIPYEDYDWEFIQIQYIQGLSLRFSLSDRLTCLSMTASCVKCRSST